MTALYRTCTLLFFYSAGVLLLWWVYPLLATVYQTCCPRWQLFLWDDNVVRTIVALLTPVLPLLLVMLAAGQQEVVCE